MIPERVSADTQSNAEKELFRQLRHLPDTPWRVALHSLNLSEHQHQQMGEIDFLLIGTHGVLVLEVKGGRVSIERGVWTHTNRFGKTARRRKSPFDQARTAMFSLRDRLQELIDPEFVRGVTFGYGVILPDTLFDLQSVEWSEEMILDRQGLSRPDGLLRGLNRLGTYWRAKPGSRGGNLTENDTNRLVTALRPAYDIVPTLGNTLRESEVELAALTQKQYEGLDAHARNARIIYEGGAGTGKTLLAAELARRRAADGAAVLFTCHSPIISAFVASQPGMGEVTVVEFGRLDSLVDHKFDILVVDEAQDLINTTALATLESLLLGGLQDGHWLFFLDTNNQRGLVGAFDPEAMEYLRLTRPAEFVLTDNCRNTSTVVRGVNELTGADVGVSTAGTGPEITYVRASQRDVLIEKIASTLDQLSGDDVSPDQIILLSPLKLKESIFGALPSRWRMRIDGVDLRTWRRRPSTRLGFARIGEFKGLESPFVILGDVELSGGAETRPELYVGMTRARIGLVVASLDAGTSEHTD